MNHRLTQMNNHFSMAAASGAGSNLPDPGTGDADTAAWAWTMKTFVPFEFRKTESRSLKGQTVFITGASRGIGLEIAKRCARDGANVAIAAKTVVAHPKLPGTIYTAAKEIEEAGGRALAIQCDIRDADSV